MAAKRKFTLNDLALVFGGIGLLILAVLVLINSFIVALPQEVILRLVLVSVALFILSAIVRTIVVIRSRNKKEEKEIPNVTIKKEP